MTKPLLARRFLLTERYAHWTNAIGFLTLLTTGALLFFKRPLGFGGDTADWLVNVHLAAACLYVGGPILSWLIGDTASWRRWVGDAFDWQWRDLLWLALIGPHLVVRRIRLPPQGRFNAGQRLNLLAQFLLKIAFCVTGLALFLGQGQLGMLHAHLACAAAATFLLMGHLFMAVVNPDTRHSLRGILTGWVRAEWARHHHLLWFERDDTVVRGKVENVKGAGDEAGPAKGEE